MARRRLLRELKTFQNDPPPFCSLGTVTEDMLRWQVTITGPPDCPYAGGQFLVAIRIPPDYPISEPPKVMFRTKIFHPNIDSNGNVCLDILTGEHWSVMMHLSTGKKTPSSRQRFMWDNVSSCYNFVVLSICALLTGPNFDDPLVPEVSEMYRADRTMYEATAHSWTQRHAMG